MSIYTSFHKRHVILSFIIIVIWMLWLPRGIQHTSPSAGTPHNVHVAFGFHVNLYHSFRGDTNDENGFGQDIRVIRHIIRELDRFNQDGITVRAVWDFDNLFSLEEILPAHAPDIISDVQRRVRENMDEVILMSYNNGLASAMNHQEFTASVERAISNEEGSGVQDLFGRASPVVRPQEMMTTAGHFERYRKMGIHYVSLYHSATPFDAFRVFSSELDRAEAHNPVLYSNPASGEQIVVIPTYHIGDLVEHVSLRNWAEELHRLQSRGDIDRDVLIFINFDADAEFWTGTDLPWHLNWLPNTGGLGQLVESVADLDFVSFTKISDYVASHPPAGMIDFSQDTADGSFNGYNSWAEKAYASDYWTRVVRNRRAHEMADRLFAITDAGAKPAELNHLLDRSFETRLRVLSTTHFGLASPFLARQREAVMTSLLERLDGHSEQIEAYTAARADALIKGTPPPSLPSPPHRLLDTFFHLDQGAAGDRWLRFTLPVEASGKKRYFLSDVSGRTIPATVTNHSLQQNRQEASITLRVSKRHDMPDGIYFLYLDRGHPTGSSTADQTVFADQGVLKNEFITVRFGENGHITSVAREGELQLDAESLTPFIIYEGRRLSPSQLTVTPVETRNGDVAAVRVHGRWDGPAGRSRSPGWVDYRLRLLRGVPYLFIDGNIRYPDTYRRHVIQAEKPMLARKIDPGWEAVAPLELRWLQRARKEQPFLIHKRNFLGKEGAYAVDYFRHSPENLNIASINNHITAEYVGVTAAGSGLAVAMNTAVNANFAFCPFKMEYLSGSDELAIRANPFGTYHGAQVLPPTRGTRLGYEAVLLSAPQLHSAGPTYNGYHDRFELMISFFDGDAIPKDVKNDLISFARRPMVIGAGKPATPKGPPASPLPPAGFLALPYRNGILFHWESSGETVAEYRIRCKALDGSGEKSFTAAGSTIFVEASHFLGANGDYTATVERIYPDGSVSGRSPEVRLFLNQETDHTLDIPNDFKAKILWANISAWFRRTLL